MCWSEEKTLLITKCRIGISNFCVFVLISIGILFTFLWAVDSTDIFFNEVYEKAIQGNPVEQRRLGQLYHQGKFTKQDLNEARMWFQEAAQNGSKMAEDILCRDFNKCV